MHKRLIAALRLQFHPVEGSVPHNLWDFVHEFGNEVDALLYAQLFCPQFIEIERSVLLNRIPDTEKLFLDAKKTTALDLPELERSFNLLEVSYAFSERTRSSNDDGALLAELVAEAWRARLALLYAPRKFEVSILPPQQTGSVFGVDFFEVR